MTEIDAKQKITPYLWFDDQAEEAANFYISTFAAAGNRAQTVHVTRYSGPSAEATGIPEGTVMTVNFQLAGLEIAALNGGPQFNFTPAVSFFVSCESEEEIDALWQALSAGGDTLMPLDKYPFSEKYGWCNDRFGVSWQLNLTPAAQKITPFLTFVGDQFGNAEEAINFYTSLFDNAEIETIERYGPGQNENEDAVVHARFSLFGEQFMGMESSLEHDFTFTEATSFLVGCRDQEEVDKYWDALTDGGEEQPCGWLKDRYGVSWQIVPTVFFEMLSDEDGAKAQRVGEALFQMKKIDIAALEAAYNGEAAQTTASTQPA